MKYTKEILDIAVKNSFCYFDVLRYLNIKLSTGMRSYISKKIHQYNIDVSHFNRINKSHNILVNISKDWKYYLIHRNNSYRQRSCILRKYMIEYGKDYKCNKCGINNLWDSEELTLEINHINNNFCDDRPENLEFLCPNCHSQITNKYLKTKKNIKYCNCGNKIEKKSGSCKTCIQKALSTTHQIDFDIKFDKKNGKIDWPDNNLLHKLIWSMPINQISKDFGIADETIRNRCKKLGIKTPPKGYWTKIKYNINGNDCKRLC